MAVRYTFATGFAADWAASNPTLASGQPSVETDTGVVKLGDGSTPYTSLPVAFTIGASVTGAQIVDGDGSTASLTTTWSSQHIQDLVNSALQQAKAYTDQSGQSLQLVFVDQNGDGTWAARPNAAVVIARGYPGRTDVPSWLTQADQYQARS